MEVKMTRDGFFIGELSKRTGIAINTIRYYESQGILDPPKRAESGYRVYEPQAAEKLLFIKKAQRFGFTLREIQTIVQNSKNGLGPCCDHVRVLLDRKLKELDATIRELGQMRRDLKKVIQLWIPTKDARKKSYAVCPQFERPELNRKHRNRNSNRVHRDEIR